MSFFTFRRVAEGYAAYRPQYHPLIMQKIRDRLALKDTNPLTWSRHWNG